MPFTPAAAPSSTGQPQPPPDAGVDLATFFDVSLDLLVIRDLEGRIVRVSASWAATPSRRLLVASGETFATAVSAWPTGCPASRHTARNSSTRRACGLTASTKSATWAINRSSSCPGGS